MKFIQLLWGTVIYRPYVYAFFACYLVFALRQLRLRGTIIYTVLAYLIAFVSEFSATRNGFPFGIYVYLDSTRERELWVSNVPFWDSLSFVFLSYFSWLMASALRAPSSPSSKAFDPFTAVLGGFLMMMLDVVIDPLTLLGDRWFLGKIYYYPSEGFYFGVTLANFLGWFFVGTATVAAFQFLCKKGALGITGIRPLSSREAWGAFCVYAGVFLFNLGVTAWIREWDLFLASAAIVAVVLAPSFRILQRAE